MRKRELDKFKKRLHLERQGIYQHLNRLQDDSETQLSGGGGDAVDLASVEITQAAIQKLGNREKKLLKKIEYSLEKIENGNYGICERCEEKIAIARLEARPVAQYCIDCKTELEQDERRYGENDDDSSWQVDDFDDSA